MARFELDIDHDFDFKLIGIASHLPDYRLCWALNRSLGLNLSRTENPLKSLQKDKVTYISFDVFCYTDEENQAEYNLIDNIFEGIRLIPELKQADYLLLVKGLPESDYSELAASVNQLEQVLTAFKVDVEELKSKEKLLF